MTKTVKVEAIKLVKLGKVSKETKGQSGPWVDFVYRRGDIP